MRNKIHKLLSVMLILPLVLGSLPAATIATSAAADSDAAEHIIYHCDFSTNPFEDGWRTDDWDEDGHAWEYIYEESPVYLHRRKGALRSASYEVGALTPDNVLYSPWIDIPGKGTTTLRFWARGTHEEDFAEKFMVCFVIKDGGNSLHMFEDAIYVTDNKWNEYVIDISADRDGELKGKSISIIIRHYDCTDQFYLVVDDFHVTNVGAPVTVYSFDFESDPFKNGWSRADMDGDGHDWIYDANAGSDTDVYPRSFSGSGAVYSESYRGGALTPNNRLWSPYFTVPTDGDTTVSVKARGSHRTAYAEHFDIAYAEYAGDPVPSMLAPEWTATLDWRGYAVYLPNYLKGKRIRICISHLNCTNQNRLYLDDFSVEWHPPADIVYSFNFESDPYLCGWYDSEWDNDGLGWSYQNERFEEYTYDKFNSFTHGGDGAMFSASWWEGRALTPDNLLVTPRIYVPDTGRTTLSIWARGCDSNDYAETFEICYLYNYGSDSGSVTRLQSAAFTTTNEWKEYTVDIYPWLAGEQVRFIIRHCGCTDQLRLYIDDLSIKNTKTSVMKGDLDKDGEITVGDALIALRIAAKLLEATEEDVLIGDVDNDGEITVSDALKILRVAAKLEAQSALG